GYSNRGRGGARVGGAGPHGHRGDGDVMRFGDKLAELFGADRVRPEVPLAGMTTFRVGGPAEWLIETRTSDEIVAALRVAHQEGVSTTILGGGSNVLVSDAGIRGLVIRPRGGGIQLPRARPLRAY